MSAERRALLESYSTPAVLLSLDYRVLAANRAYRSHHQRPMKEGRDHCFAVSHGYASPCDQNGESCPLRRARESGHAERVVHIHRGPRGREYVDVTLTPLRDEGGEIEGFLELIAPITLASAQGRGQFVGASPAFLSALELIQRGASSDVPILLLGESGTGKELAARAIHAASPRRSGPFVAVECSGIGEALFESELFGHARGAFTGAHGRKTGLVDAARSGTLFLDEIGDVPLSLQVKLLRLLESGTYRPVGDVEPRQASFRLVCATHRDLDARVRSGEFRRDLLYRINAFPIAMPALRERRSDIPLLCEALLSGSGKRLGRAALDRLEAHDFPGNVRELKNVLERAVLLADGPEIGVPHLPASAVEAAAGGGASSAGRAARGAEWPWGDSVVELREVEQRYLRWAAERHAGDRRQLAARLGMSERTLYRKLRGLG